jgi:predicted enzyme related to lactoylglutathione lyase
MEVPMIQKMSHTIIHVQNQESAKQFYTEKLGFEVRTDITMGQFRWLTVSPKGDPLELVLMPLHLGPHVDEASLKVLKELVSKGVAGGGIYVTADCKKTYEQLKERGVNFASPPTERPHGIEAMFSDDSGNTFSLLQVPTR